MTTPWALRFGPYVGAFALMSADFGERLFGIGGAVPALIIGLVYAIWDLRCETRENSKESPAMTSPPPRLAPVACPFCDETDFDLIGLKLHLTRGHCNVFNDTPMNDPPKATKEAAP